MAYTTTRRKKEDVKKDFAGSRFSRVFSNSGGNDSYFIVNSDAVPPDDTRQLPEVLKAASELVSTWKQNPDLMKRVKQIRSVVTQRERDRGRIILVLRFECDLPGKKA